MALQTRHISVQGYPWGWLHRYMLLLLLALLLFSTSTLHASPRYRVIVMPSMSVPTITGQTAAFIKHLDRLGFRDQHNLDLQILHPQGDRSRARQLLSQAVASKRPDLVVTSATLASQEAMDLLAEDQIPLLFMTVADPVGAGLVPALGQVNKRPISGRANAVDRSILLDMVKRILTTPTKQRPIRIGLIHTDYPSAVGDAQLLEQVIASEPLITLEQIIIPYQPIPKHLPMLQEHLIQAIQALEDRVDYWWSAHGPLADNDHYLSQFKQHSKHPMLFGIDLKSVKRGALIHISPDMDAAGQEVAHLASAILLGASPGEIPVAVPKQITMSINLATAIRMNLVIPSQMMELAKGNLYHEVLP
ncbi:ABC transporter substrate-binding protein [Magnetococcus sp. PR-3]|uniref:ABC transporter substrate-binding protein n=1 Tax=Magnetococcus sp. PR-3 TaxID=3120355 RepID=UPI002FCE3454